MSSIAGAMPWPDRLDRRLLALRRVACWPSVAVGASCAGIGDGLSHWLGLKVSGLHPDSELDTHLDLTSRLAVLTPESVVLDCVAPLCSIFDPPGFGLLMLCGASRGAASCNIGCAVCERSLNINKNLCPAPSPSSHPSPMLPVSSRGRHGWGSSTTSSWAGTSADVVARVVEPTASSPKAPAPPPLPIRNRQELAPDYPGLSADGEQLCVESVLGGTEKARLSLRAPSLSLHPASAVPLSPRAMSNHADDWRPQLHTMVRRRLGSRQVMFEREGQGGSDLVGLCRRSWLAVQDFR
ncbi:hypothetical protein DFP72DRAFT_1082057 [Ephemerocybe angulata]|uniref:Uncharacterized protein n=1 Tax=Ephemerocybe angulata TaxID=980116 RepID=A0A8H6H8F6_9AGAR|nr:hypothetical protein DFP72DRAFT_1082057 [Tulosesus angulatus]